MQLTPTQLAGWLEVTGVAEVERADRLEALQAKASDPLWMARRFVAVHDGRVIGATWLVDVGVHRWLLGAPRTLPGCGIGEPTAALVDEAVASLRDGASISLEARIPTERLSEALQAAVDRTGAVRGTDRIEYKTPIADLPEHPAGPLQWRSASSDRLDEVAALLAAVATGPDGLEPGEDPREWIDSVLQTPGRTTDPATCIHIGQLDGTDVALVCAQTEPDGWSTITYMGLTPEARGRGLGNWAHRHGISMLRSQGATLYHGGTDAENTAMRACFSRQRCTPCAHFAVFRWTPPAL